MKRHMKILVTGAAGNTGSLLVPKLISSGEDVKVFVRDAEKAESFKKLGAEVVTGDHLSSLRMIF